MNGAAGAILVDGDTILLGRRSRHKSFPGQWDIIGGHIEAGETAWAALCRELWEEIGIDAVAGDHLATIVLDAPEPLTLHVYGLSSWQGAPFLRNDEHSELRWFTIDAIAHMTDLVSPLYRPVIASLRS